MLLTKKARLRQSAWDPSWSLARRIQWPRWFSLATRGYRRWAGLEWIQVGRGDTHQCKEISWSKRGIIRMRKKKRKRVLRDGERSKASALTLWLRTTAAQTARWTWVPEWFGSTFAAFSRIVDASPNWFIWTRTCKQRETRVGYWGKQ